MLRVSLTCLVVVASVGFTARLFLISQSSATCGNIVNVDLAVSPERFFFQAKSKKNLILTCMNIGQEAPSGLFRNPEYVLRRTFLFLDSLRKASVEADVVFLTNTEYDKPLQQMLKRYNARVVLMTDSDSFFEGHQIPPGNVLRHAWYIVVLKKLGSRYHRVLVSDVRDIYFQRDPFQPEFTRHEALLTQESLRPAFNGSYFTVQSGLSGYTPDEITACTEPAISGGVMLGSPSGLLNVCVAVVKEARRRSYFLHDQHYFNHLLRLGRLPGVEVIANRLLVWHMGSKPVQFRMNEFGEFLNDRGHVLPILHQYDRPHTAPVARFLEVRHPFRLAYNRTHSLSEIGSLLSPSAGG